MFMSVSSSQSVNFLCASFLFNGMDAVHGPDIGDMISVDQQALAALQDCFYQIECLLDRNRFLIKEINQNHGSQSRENLRRNETLINELNANMQTVLNLYGTLSVAFFKAFESMPDGGTTMGAAKTDRVNFKSTTVQGFKREVLALERQLHGLQVGTSSMPMG